MNLTDPPEASAWSCDACLTRTWLLARLSGYLETVRGRVPDLLALSDDELIEALAGAEAARIADERSGVNLTRLRRQLAAAGLHTVCRCAPAYPPALLALPTPPAMLHLAGSGEWLERLARDGDAVAIVGSRTPTGYGREMARVLARDLGAAGVTVISGLARGIDAAVHEGALAGGGTTLAVLPGSAATPYPAGARRLYYAILQSGAAISEFAPGAPIRRWTFVARNRIVAGLARLTIVVEAGARSGALITADLAEQSGRAVGAVPGRVTTPQAAGPNGLLATGHIVIRGAQDVLDALYGAGSRAVPHDTRPPPSRDAAVLMTKLDEGTALGRALELAGFTAERGLAVLGELELSGWIKRGPGGAVTVLP